MMVLRILLERPSEKAPAKALKPFLDVLLPLASGNSDGRHFEVMALLRDFCPRVDKNVLRTVPSTSQVLSELKNDLHTLSKLMAKEGTRDHSGRVAFCQASRIGELR